MKFEWNEKKDQINYKKHGLSFKDVVILQPFNGQ